ncbi:MAG: response regulator transcription factor, partial [Blautia sp.]|nr:response regulator transcription factor [Blautia sp.]
VGSSSYDILLLDIDMPGVSGMDTARQVRQSDPLVVIVFITNMAQYAIHGYEVEALDYIMKPVGFYDFSLKFQRAVRRAARRGEQKLVLNTGEGGAVVAVKDIFYVEVFGHYLLYHLKGDEAIRVRGSLSEQEPVLRGFHFARAHKSFLVNMEHITNYTPTEVSVAGKSVPLGRAYKKEMLSEYMAYLRG